MIGLSLEQGRGLLRLQVIANNPQGFADVL